MPVTPSSSTLLPSELPGALLAAATGALEAAGAPACMHALCAGPAGDCLGEGLCRPAALPERGLRDCMLLVDPQKGVQSLCSMETGGSSTGGVCKLQLIKLPLFAQCAPGHARGFNDISHLKLNMYQGHKGSSSAEKENEEADLAGVDKLNAVGVFAGQGQSG